MDESSSSPPSKPRKPKRAKEYFARPKTLSAQGLADRVVILAAAGQPVSEIAKAVDRSPERVGQLLNPGTMPEERRELMEKARARVQERAIVLMEKHLETMDKSFEGAPLGHQASAMKVLGEASQVGGFNRVPAMPVAPAGLTINLSDPSVVAGFVEALRLLNEPGSRVIDVTPPQPALPEPE